MSYGRTDDRAPFRAKVRDASWACRGVVFSAALPWCSGGETDGILAPAFERDCIYGRDGKRAFREAVERGFIHRAGELCERCLAELRNAGTMPPKAGHYLHDYLKHNPAKREIERRRVSARERQSAWRNEQKQAHLGLDSHTPLSRVSDSPALPGVGEETTESSNGPTPEILAAANAVLERLYAVERFRANANEVEDPIRVVNFMSMYPTADPLLCADIAAQWGRGSGWGIDDGVVTFSIALRGEMERAAAKADAAEAAPDFSRFDRVMQR